MWKVLSNQSNCVLCNPGEEKSGNVIAAQGLRIRCGILTDDGARSVNVMARCDDLKGESILEDSRSSRNLTHDPPDDRVFFRVMA